MRVLAQAKSPEITRVTLGVSGGSAIFTDKFEKDPPAIIIEFLSRNVMTTLESVVSVELGMVREIMSTYYPVRLGRRALKRITLRLREPARYTLTQRGERLLIDIETPRSLASGETVPAGGMTILGIESQGAIIQRLNVMDAALQEAAQAYAPESRNPNPVVITRPAPVPLPGAERRHNSTPVSPSGAGGWWYGLLLGAGMTAVGIGGWRIRRRTALPEPNLPMVATGTPLAARGAPVLEQLVLRAMQQRHYEILDSKLIPGLPRLWIVKKGSQRQGVVCLSNGTLFECGVIKQVAEAIHGEGLAGGTVVAMGAFSFPAKLIAKERQIRLIAREELLTLIDSELRGAEPLQRAMAPVQELTQARNDLARACAKIKALEEERLSDKAMNAGDQEMVEQFAEEQQDSAS